MPKGNCFLLLLLLGVSACDAIDPGSMPTVVVEWQDSPFLPLVCGATMVVLSLLFVPISILLLSSALLLSPITSAITSIVATVLAGLCGFWLGRLAGRSWVERHFHGVSERIRAQLSGRQTLSVIIVRNLPIAPFTAVNIALGTFPLRSLAFALGTALGILPFVCVLSLLDYQLLLSEEGLDATTGITLGALTLAFATIAFFIKRRSER